MSAFDALDAMRRMEAAGIERAKAEAIAESIGLVEKDLAAKSDMNWIEWILAVLAALQIAVAARVFRFL